MDLIRFSGGVIKLLSYTFLSAPSCHWQSASEADYNRPQYIQTAHFVLLREKIARQGIPIRVLSCWKKSDSPTTCRFHRWVMTHKYIQPSLVAQYVMSDTHTFPGAFAKNCRSRIFSATGSCWLEFVVRRYFFLCTQPKCASLIRRATHLELTRYPRLVSSSRILGLP